MPLVMHTDHRERRAWMKPKQPRTPADRRAKGPAHAETISVRGRGEILLTQLRSRLLELLRKQPDRPLGAYALTRGLEASLGRNVTPTSVYRSLDFLMHCALVVRVESRNAYLPCPTPGRPFKGAFLVCDKCGIAVCVEDATLPSLMTGKAARLGFSVRRRIIELHGICARCSVAR